MRSRDRRKMAVVLKGYPRLSETFIAQELLELEERGWTFDIWSLRHPYDGGRTHPIHDRIQATPRYLPEYLRNEPGRVLRSWWAVRDKPGYAKARSTWLHDLRRDRSPNRVRRWGQALVLAAELGEDVPLLYAHFLHTPTSVTRYAALILGIPFAFSAHAKDIWTIPDWEISEKIADAAFGVTCTGTGAQHLRSFPAGEKVRLVYHGLDLGRFPAPPERGGKGASFSILSVGRLVAKKGYDDLLDALASLSDRDWRFIHIGGGELKSDLSERATKLGIVDCIEWRGKQNQSVVVEAMRNADLFVLPSKIASDGDRDGLPNVLMEAASQKLPIVSTNVSAIPEFIEDGVHGVLVPPADPTALARAIASAMESTSRRAEMAEAAYQRLVELFKMETGMDILDERLSSVVVE